MLSAASCAFEVFKLFNLIVSLKNLRTQQVENPRSVHTENQGNLPNQQIRDLGIPHSRFIGGRVRNRLYNAQSCTRYGKGAFGMFRVVLFGAGILELSMEARNRVRVGLLYQATAWRNRLRGNLGNAKSSKKFQLTGQTTVGGGVILTLTRCQTLSPSPTSRANNGRNNHLLLSHFHTSLSIR